jgi:hypothetical protein
MDLKFLLLEEAGRPAGTVVIDADALPEEVRPAAAGGGAQPLEGFVLLEHDAGMRSALAQVLPRLVGRVREQLRSQREQDLESLLDELLAAPRLPGRPGSETERAFVIAGAARRQAFLDEWPFLTAEQVHQAAGLAARNVSATASRWKAAGEIFSVRAGRQDLYPLFQFRDGRPRPELKPVLEVFGKRRDGWQIALWLTTANGWLPGEARPIDLLQDDPEAVVRAARMAMAEPAA